MPGSLPSLSDLHLILRQLRRSRGFAPTAVLTLALGVGVNVIAFGVIDALLLRKLPVPNPNQLSFVQHPAANDVTLAFPVYRDLRERNRTFSEMGAYNLAPVGVNFHGEAEQRWATLATGTYFDLLGVRPFLGRFPTAVDDARGTNASPFVVLTYETWKNDFNADPNILGRKILLSKSPFTVIGVAPPGFYGTERFLHPALWIDLWNAPQVIGGFLMDDRTAQWAWIIGRRRPGVTLPQAEADLNRIAAELAREHPKSDAGNRFALSEPGYIGNFLGPALHAFLGGVMVLTAIVLFAACVNLGGLYAARATDRRRDIAVRLALGATRARIRRDLFLESLLLGLAGGLLGCVLARLALHALTGYRPPFEFPIAVIVDPSPRVYAFALLLSVIAGLLCGIIPARETRRTDLQEILKTGTQPSSGHPRLFTLRDALLLLEVALCCVLVTASAVSLRGLLQSRNLPLGFNPHGVTVALYNPNVAGYKPDDVVRFSHTLADSAARIPGVESAAFASNTPLTVGGDNDFVYRNDGTELRPEDRLFSAPVYTVSPGYFHTAGTTLLAGREFTWNDDGHAPPVAIINQRFASLLFGARPAVGESFRTGSGKPIRIVGVVQNGKYSTLNEAPQPAIFLPFAQDWEFFSKLLVRLTPAALGDEARIDNAVTTLIHAQDPNVPISGIETWQAALAPVLFPARAATIALGVLGALALTLALTGIFGLASYTVARRMREFGIRVALGAARTDVLRAALSRILRVVAIGAVAGLAAGLASTRLLAAIVYGARPNDPWVLFATAATMCLIAVLATAAPARRALRVQPNTLLREE